MLADPPKAILFTLRGQPAQPRKYSFPANCILQSTSRILDLAGGLLRDLNVNKREGAV